MLRTIAGWDALARLEGVERGNPHIGRLDRSRDGTGPKTLGEQGISRAGNNAVASCDRNTTLADLAEGWHA
jgi:hypothetical protein